jgi:hypothetical protein
VALSNNVATNLLPLFLPDLTRLSNITIQRVDPVHHGGDRYLSGYRLMVSMDGGIGFRVAFKHLGEFHFLHSNSVLDIDRPVALACWHQRG